jgi:hypothetical protein
LTPLQECSFKLYRNFHGHLLTLTTIIVKENPMYPSSQIFFRLEHAVITRLKVTFHVLNLGIYIQIFKAACLHMNINISRKSNLRNKYWDIKKSKKIQDKSNTLHAMCNLWPILQTFYPVSTMLTNTVRAIFTYFDLFENLHEN